MREAMNSIQNLIDAAKEWREWCLCSNGDDHAKMDTCITAAEEFIKPVRPKLRIDHDEKWHTCCGWPLNPQQPYCGYCRKEIDWSDK